MTDLFSGVEEHQRERIGEGACYFPGFALADAEELFTHIGRVTAQAGFRTMKTPGGRSMSAEMTGCGQFSWVSDNLGYRYSEQDPLTGRPWPEMPPAFADLAHRAAAGAGYPGFQPDVCLINRYGEGARMGLHQDRDEQDLQWPIVSVSLGLPMTFLWGGLERKGGQLKLVLNHGDVLVWGGADRLRYHGVAPLKQGHHALTGAYRYNLTFRRALD